MLAESQTPETRIHFEEDPALIPRRAFHDLYEKIGKKYGVGVDDVRDIGICIYKDIIIRRIWRLKFTASYYIGRLAVGNECVKKNWALSIYGKEFVPELTELITELSKPFNANVNITLKSDFAYPDPRLQSYD